MGGRALPGSRRPWTARATFPRKSRTAVDPSQLNRTRLCSAVRPRCHNKSHESKTTLLRPSFITVGVLDLRKMSWSDQARRRGNFAGNSVCLKITSRQLTFEGESENERYGMTGRAEHNVVSESHNNIRTISIIVDLPHRGTPAAVLGERYFHLHHLLLAFPSRGVLPIVFGTLPSRSAACLFLMLWCLKSVHE